MIETLPDLTYQEQNPANYGSTASTGSCRGLPSAVYGGLSQLPTLGFWTFGAPGEAGHRQVRGGYRPFEAALKGGRDPCRPEAAKRILLDIPSVCEIGVHARLFSHIGCSSIVGSDVAARVILWRLTGTYLKDSNSERPQDLGCYLTSVQLPECMTGIAMRRADCRSQELYSEPTASATAQRLVLEQGP